MVDIFIMGKKYEVPKGLTIQKALEYAGMRLLRGCGCRGGFCGACGTVYRTEGDYKLKVALACQTVVEDGMYLTQIPFYPGQQGNLRHRRAGADARGRWCSATPRSCAACSAIPAVRSARRTSR